MEQRTLGLYIHIPFCRSKCLYCDFCSFPHPDEAVMAEYVTALKRDLAARAQLCTDYTVDSVFFGGGTPTLLPDAQLCSVLECVAAHYHLSPDAEVSAECNPATGGLDYFRAMRRAGFNRLSIGLQSIHANELRALGRLHGFDGFVRTYHDARAAGFSNLGVDLMSGIPHQTKESFLESLASVVALAPEHISAYGLSVEEGTPFARMGERLLLPDEDAAREMYFAGSDFLREAGYEHYEISNFARQGYRSRHNLKYWSCLPYLGFGPAAYSDFSDERFGNSRDLAAYNRGECIEEMREHADAGERRGEYVMLRLRLSDGVDRADFSARFGEDFDALYGKTLLQYEKLGLAEQTHAGWRLTLRGWYVSNTLLCELLEF